MPYKYKPQDQSLWPKDPEPVALTSKDKGSSFDFDSLYRSVFEPLIIGDTHKPMAAPAHGFVGEGLTKLPEEPKTKVVPKSDFSLKVPKGYAIDASVWPTFTRGEPVTWPNPERYVFECKWNHFVGFGTHDQEVDEEEYELVYPTLQGTEDFLRLAGKRTRIMIEVID